MFDKDPQEFINEGFKIVGIMELSIVEKLELTSYQLKGDYQVWFNQLKKESIVDTSPLDWTNS